MAVCSVLLLGIIRTTLEGQRQLRVEQRSMQAERVAEAALARGAARLQSDAEYHGEKWEMPAEHMGGRDAAVAEIRVEKVADRPADRRIVVTAEYPAVATLRARKSSVAVVTVAEQETR